MRPLPQPWHGVVAQGPQAPLQVQGLSVSQVQPDRRAAAGHGRPGRAQAAAGGRGRHRHGHPLHLAQLWPVAARARLPGWRRAGRQRDRRAGRRLPGKIAHKQNRHI